VVNSDLTAIGAAMGRIPSGCAILTVQYAARATGVLVSWIQQASFEPLSVSVCLRTGRPAAELIEGAGRFLLNLVGEDPKAMFRHFGRGFSLEENAFEGIETEPSPYGAKLAGCIAHLGCQVQQKIAVGDHDLYVATVVQGAALEGARPYVHLRNSGLSY
jgi:flavin reductase (DIM6/NTAB) family NADH-FMN oxidoreductase RutF